MPSRSPKLTIRPLTPSRWDDFERLFGPRGACAGCWCMWPRLSGPEWTRGRGAANKRKMKQIVDAAREPPGLLAYVGGEPIGWIALAPRRDYVRGVKHPRGLPVLEQEGVWSVVCFFVAREHRGRGLTPKLLAAAAEHAKQRGARILEGYPSDPKARQADAFVWTGVLPAFEKAGFEEVARRSPSKAIVRLRLD